MKDKLIKDIRYLRVFLILIKKPLLVLLFLIFGGATIMFYSDINDINSFTQSVYVILSISTFSDWKSFPQERLMQFFYFLIPILSLTGGISLVREIFTSLVSMNNRTTEWEACLASLTRNTILVCGLGKIGTKVVKALVLKGYQWNIVVVHNDPTHQSLYEVRKLGIPVIIGDMTAESTLIQANVKNSKTIILATENDETHFKSLLKLNELVKDAYCPNVIFNVFDFRVAEMIHVLKSNLTIRLKLHPVNLSKELANSFYEIIKENLRSTTAKLALCGLGRVGFKVIETLVAERIVGDEPGILHFSNFTIIDINLNDNLFLKREPIVNIPKKNLIEMDLIDFYFFTANKFDVCIVTTGDDLSNLIFDSKSNMESLNIIRTKQDILMIKKENTNSINKTQKNNTIFVNTTLRAANKIINVFEECH